MNLLVVMQYVTFIIQVKMIIMNILLDGMQMVLNYAIYQTLIPAQRLGSVRTVGPTTSRIAREAVERGRRHIY